MTVTAGVRVHGTPTSVMCPEQAESATRTTRPPISDAIPRTSPGVCLALAPLAGEAQQPGKVYRIGVLTNKASDPAEARLWQAFRSGLRERGWIEGQNILIEFRAAEGNTARLAELAGRLGSTQGGPDRGSVLHFCAGCERGDTLDPHRLSNSCRPSRDRPRHEPRAARREHHRTGHNDDRPCP
jgi:hypothetical protein